VDGQNHALERKSRIEWLKGSTDGACRILSNARCLSEGIDVPALDAVIFMTERRSVVDIVQAVGRAMRKADGKTYGYIVLPVAVPAGRDPALILDSGKEFDVVWSVLRALRSHDDRLDAEINKIDLNDIPRTASSSTGTGSTATRCPMRRRCPSRRSTFRPAPSTRRSSRSAGTGSTGRAGPGMSPTSSSAW